ncbi:MAG: hypothetical protein C5B52_07845 [Bacteroidetes bacterium]|nr:MAG: hypothetical protein C5B52_07845 [Bacteroidota bacterium]
MRSEGGKQKWNYYWKAIKWLLGNGFWTLLPLWFILFMSGLSDGKFGTEEIFHLIVHDGLILFVCCAIAGSTLVDLILTDRTARIISFIWIALIPCFLALVILADYALIIGKFIDPECFKLTSKTSLAVILVTIFYCVFVKAQIYHKEETKNATNAKNVL